MSSVPSPFNALGPARPAPAVGWLGVSIRAWWMAGLLLACFVGLYHQSLVRLWIKTNPIDGSAEWAHAMFVPIIGLYYLYLNIDDLKRARPRPLLGLDFYAGRFVAAGLAIGGGLVLWFGVASMGGVFAGYAPEITALGKGLVLLGSVSAIFDWGLGTLLCGLFMYGYGIWPGANDFLRDFGMVTSVFGIVLTLCGWQVMRIAWFPCVFLACMLPWPGLLYSKLAMPMQELSAHVGVTVMQICGVNVEKIGTTMLMNRPPPRGPRPLDVAEACAGLKSLMTFVSLGAAVAFLSPRPLWQRLIITFAAVPIAILCNALRVSGQGLLDYYVDESWSTGFAHQFAGLVMLLPGFLLLMGVVWLLDQLFVDADEDEPTKPQSPSGASHVSAGSSVSSGSGAKPQAAVGGAS